VSARSRAAERWSSWSGPSDRAAALKNPEQMLSRVGLG
jgi:hypothetical protein